MEHPNLPSDMSNQFAPESHIVLVVDDTAANRRLYGALLARSGYQVETASDGYEALEAVQVHQPSLVLLDYMMPRMDGLEVIRKLRADANTRELPIVVLTASAEPTHIDAALEEGANDYITKPVNGKILMARVKAMIRADRSREAHSERQTSALFEELQEAARVQQSQLPIVPAHAGDWLLTGAVSPSGQVGGDIFDIVQTSSGSTVGLLLDVSGHGTASALVAAETRTEMRNLLALMPLGDAMSTLNKHMARRETGKYSCLAAVELFESHVQVVNAGLPPVALLRDGEIVELIQASGLPIGMFDDARYETREIYTRPGDRIILLSDGLTEPYGPTDDTRGAIERLRLWPHVDDSLPEAELLNTTIKTLMQDMAAEVVDDATVLVIHNAASKKASMTVPALPGEISSGTKKILAECPDWVEHGHLDQGITEALSNAVLHGCLELSSEGRETNGYEEFLKKATTRPDFPRFKGRAVYVRTLATEHTFGLNLEWSGQSCPEELRKQVRNRSESPHASGMGQQIIHELFDRVCWSEDGYSLDLWLYRKPETREPTQ
jgi:sigma-B regulation protein RsbU (phosphoserine phosphatase)